MSSRIFKFIVVGKKSSPMLPHVGLALDGFPSLEEVVVERT